MDPKSDEGIFLGYSTNNRAYRVFNSIIKIMIESINVVVDDLIIEKWIDVEDDVGTSSLKTGDVENEVYIESNIDPAGTEQITLK